MFRPVKGPLWAQAYQKNMKAYADLGPDIFSELHANIRRAHSNWAKNDYGPKFACSPLKISGPKSA